MVHNTFTRYSVMTLGALVILLCLSAAFTWFVNPYEVHTLTRVSNFNAIKPHAYTHASTAKTALALRMRPRLLLLGNSRIDAGIDPDSSLVPGNLRPAFNLAIPGAGLETNRRNLLAVDSNSRIQRVILGLDFLDFPAPRNALIHSSSLVPSAKPDAQPNKLKILTETTFSLDSLIDAIDTVRVQNEPHSQNMTTAGFNPFAEYNEFVRQEGHWAIFHQRNVENARSYLRKTNYLVEESSLRAPDFFQLQRIIEWCNKRRIRLDLVIYPYHAHILELFDMAGLWTAFEKWKQLLVVQVDRPGNDLVTLWDFSGYHEIGTEAVPPKGDTKTQMKWYWEAGHFKSTLGDEILRAIFKAKQLDPIGIRLSSANVTTTLRDIRTQRSTWRSANQHSRNYLRSITTGLNRSKN